MKQMQFTAVTTAGRSIPLGAPCFLQARWGMESPADSLQILFAAPPRLPEPVQELTSPQMPGVWRVDEQALRLAGEGALLELSTRSPGGLLLDNEAPPQVYYHLRLGDVFRSHIAPYGFSLDAPQNPALAEFVVGRGLSRWEVFSTFCVQALDRQPMVRGNQVTLRRAQGQPAVVGNTGKVDTLAYISAEDGFNRAALPSALYVSGQEGGSPIRVENPLTAPLQLNRVRYLPPTKEFAHNPRLDALQRMCRAGLAAHRVEVTLPGFSDLEVGRRVQLRDAVFAASGLFVYQKQYQLDEQGVRTTLTLAEEGYL